QPRMEHTVGGAAHPLDPDRAAGRMEQGQLFGRPPADILMRVADRLAGGMPLRARIGHGLGGTRLVFSPYRHPLLGVGGLNQVFFATASGSTTVTVPLLRLRMAVPVSHQLRSLPQSKPASCRTHQMV